MFCVFFKLKINKIPLDRLRLTGFTASFKMKSGIIWNYLNYNCLQIHIVGIYIYISR